MEQTYVYVMEILLNNEWMIEGVYANKKVADKRYYLLKKQKMTVSLAGFEVE